MSRTTSAQQILARDPIDELGRLPDAYWEIIDRYRGELINQAFSILGSLSDAEDVVQESFCEVLRDGQKLAAAHSVGAWLRRVNRANALNRLRSQKRDRNKNDRSQKENPKRPATTGGLSVVELRESVAMAVESLPERERSVIVLRYWEHLSYGDIARRLGMPEGTVARLLYEATQRLYSGFDGYLETPPPTGSEITEHPNVEDSNR